MEEPFWKTKTLAQMSQGEWESLCDGCGRCCLNKLEDWETGELYWTNVACHMLDGHSCRCKDYANRLDHVPDCIQLDPQMINELEWLPPSCAYRLVNEGKDLYPWHPLISGNPESVHEAGISARGRSIPDTGIEVEDFEDFIVKWPGEMPGKKRARKVRERG
jgi:uncharacterized cysteine cluster protein YcgN (CxxCxxCC family)